MSNWLTNLASIIDRAYERRLSRASGQSHTPAQPAAQHEYDDEAGAITNVPRGSVVVETNADEDDEEGVITNLPRGAEHHE